MAKLKKKKRTAQRKSVAPKPRAQSAEFSFSQPSSNSSLPNLNQDAPKLNYKIVGTPILPGSK